MATSFPAVANLTLRRYPEGTSGEDGEDDEDEDEDEEDDGEEGNNNKERNAATKEGR